MAAVGSLIVDRLVNIFFERCDEGTDGLIQSRIAGNLPWLVDACRFTAVVPLIVAANPVRAWEPVDDDDVWSRNVGREARRVLPGGNVAGSKERVEHIKREGKEPIAPASAVSPVSMSVPVMTVAAATTDYVAKDPSWGATEVLPTDRRV